jgi:hypothetical protein
MTSPPAAKAENLDTCACYSVHFIFEHHFYGLIFGKPSACEKRQPTASLDAQQPICSIEQFMRAARLQDALERLTAAISDVESELAAMKAEHDPLASHIFISRRYYRNANDTKSGKRRETMARLSFNTACEIGFRGSLDEWEQLRGGELLRHYLFFAWNTDWTPWSFKDFPAPTVRKDFD